MTALRLNRTMKGENDQAVSEKLTSLAQRVKDYMAMYSAEIVSGMLALNGNTNAYRVYAMLKNEK